MDTNSHYGHLSVRDGRSIRVAKFFLVKPVGDASPACQQQHPLLCHGSDVKFVTREIRRAEKIFCTSNFRLILLCVCACVRVVVLWYCAKLWCAV
jgi:hypothetical protein